MTEPPVTNRQELVQLFAARGYQAGAEVGVADGRFSLELCEAIPGLRLLCVDPWCSYHGNQRGGRTDRHEKNWALAQGRLAPFGAKLMRMLSLEGAALVEDGSLDFVHLDGNHNFDYVMQDLIAWTPKVRMGGVVSGHDYYRFRNAGVIEAVDAYTSFYGVELHVTPEPRRRRQTGGPTWWWTR